MKRLESNILQKVKVLSRVINSRLEEPLNEDDLEIKELDGIFYVEFDITDEEFDKLPNGFKRHLGYEK